MKSVESFQYHGCNAVSAAFDNINILEILARYYYNDNSLVGCPIMSIFRESQMPDSQIVIPPGEFATFINSSRRNGHSPANIKVLYKNKVYYKYPENFILINKSNVLNGLKIHYDSEYIYEPVKTDNEKVIKSFCKINGGLYMNCFKPLHVTDDVAVYPDIVLAHQYTYYEHHKYPYAKVVHPYYFISAIIKANKTNSSFENVLRQYIVQC